MHSALRGPRLMALCATRFGYLQITVRDGKGGKDRLTMLPVSLAEELRRQIDAVNLQHRKDLAAGFGEVWLPHALGVKKPAASREFAWQYVFPANRLSKDPRDPSAKPRRHHVDESVPQRAVRSALKLARVRKAGTCHCRSGGYAYCAPRPSTNGALRHAFVPPFVRHPSAGGGL